MWRCTTSFAITRRRMDERTGGERPFLSVGSLITSKQSIARAHALSYSGRKIRRRQKMRSRFALGGGKRVLFSISVMHTIVTLTGNGGTLIVGADALLRAVWRSALESARLPRWPFVGERAASTAPTVEMKQLFG